MTAATWSVAGLGPGGADAERSGARRRFAAALAASALAHMALVLSLGLAGSGEKGGELVLRAYVLPHAAGRTFGLASLQGAPQTFFELQPRGTAGSSGEGGGGDGRDLPHSIKSAPPLPTDSPTSLVDEKTPTGPEEIAGAGDRRRSRVSTRWFAWYQSEINKRIRDHYPIDTMRRMDVSGEVLLRLELAPDGKVISVKIVETTSDGMAKAALEAVRDSSPFPSYKELGIDFLPPFNFRIKH